MGFLNKPHKIDNEYFGKMLFIGSKIPSVSDYFECRRHFNPIDDIIEIGIEADISGPTEKQIEFYKSIEHNYTLIIKGIIPLIEAEFKNWMRDFKILDFSNEFDPVYLKLPRCETNPFKWEIVFETIHDSNHTITLTMNDFVAKEILIES
jgi:hypothetical protein